jgi:hypothetical protein
MKTFSHNFADKIIKIIKIIIKDKNLLKETLEELIHITHKIHHSIKNPIKQLILKKFVTLVLCLGPVKR